MGTVHMNGPASPEGVCPFCLMQAKQVQWEMYQEEIKAGYEASGEKTTWIPWPAALDGSLLEGRYLAVAGDAPHLGLVGGLCWDHVAGVREPKPADSLLRADGALPPGLLKGKH